MIAGLGRSPGEGLGYPLQYSWTSLVAQVAKNLPARRETWVRSLGWEDPLEEGMATHSSIIAWRIPMVREARRATVQGVAKSRTRLSNYPYMHTYISQIMKNFIKDARNPDLYPVVN